MAAEHYQNPVRVALTGVDRNHFNTLRIPPGALVLITDVPVYELDPVYGKRARADTFTLEATDGSYKRTLVVNEDHTGDDDWVDLVFEELPTRARYTLKATLHGEDETTLFQDIPYAKLAKQSDDLKELEREPR